MPLISSPERTEETATIREIVEIILKSQGMWMNLTGAVALHLNRQISLYVTISKRTWTSFVLKKIFKAGTAFTLLVGCYFGYVQVFALVVGQLTTVRRAGNRASAP